jgi:hypothetical protein
LHASIDANRGYERVANALSSPAEARRIELITGGHFGRSNLGALDERVWIRVPAQLGLCAGWDTQRSEKVAKQGLSDPRFKDLNRPVRLLRVVSIRSAIRVELLWRH